MAGSKARSQLAGNLLATVFSVGLIAVLFLLLENGLRVLGIGAPEAAASRLAYQRLYLPILEERQRTDGTAVHATSDPRLPYQSILAAKPANSLRVVTFGGSATAGLGFSPNVTYSRHLQQLLEEAYPDRSIEMLNLGIVALASRQVKVLVAEVCERYEPDVLVVYSGNNEFLEIHAEKYAAANRSLVDSARTIAERTYFFRALRLAIHGRPKPPSLAEHDNARNDLRVTQDRIIQDIELTPEEVGAVVDHYEANIDAMAEAAAASGTPIVLASVASNWKWRGRSDLPDDWRTEFAPARTSDELVLALNEGLDAAPENERAALLFRRAVVEEGVGRRAAARASYRQAMNEDPHLRRALDEMNDRVRQVAEERNVVFLDSVAALQDDAEHGIVGFDHFYDYVHFTPRGTVVMAAALAEALERTGLLPADARQGVDVYRERELTALEGLESDPLDVDHWMGVGSDPRSQIADRDLWKYDRLLAELDARIEANGEDRRALIERGNGYYFRVGGAEHAGRAYRQALALDPDDAAVRHNLARLEAERP